MFGFLLSKASLGRESIQRNVEHGPPEPKVANEVCKRAAVVAKGCGRI